MVKLFILTFVIFFLIFNLVHAFNFGMVVKNPSVNISKNETAKFVILFWNSGNESYNVSLNVENAPKDWFIFIDPKKINLKPFEGKEYIYLPYALIKALPVKIFVKPKNIEKNEYTILISAKAYLPSNEISIVQERNISLKLYFSNFEKKQIINEEVKINKKIENGETNNYNYFFILGLILIFVFSLLIYKYA